MAHSGKTGSSEYRVRRKWDDAEDQKLLDLVRRFGLEAWRSVSAQMFDRDPKQCRERYMNHLDPTVKKEKLSLREWLTLLLAHDQHGNKWSEISLHLPGRTANTIKNFWHSTLRPSAIEEIFGTAAYESGSRVPKIPLDDRPLRDDVGLLAPSKPLTSLSIPNSVPTSTTTTSATPNATAPPSLTSSAELRRFSFDAMEVEGEDESTSSVSNANRTQNSSAISSPREMMVTDSLAVPTPQSASSPLSLPPMPFPIFSEETPFSAFAMNPLPPIQPSIPSQFENAQNGDAMEIDEYPMPASTLVSQTISKLGSEIKPSHATSAPFPRLWDALVETAMSEYEYEAGVSRTQAILLQQQQQQAHQYYLLMTSMLANGNPIIPGQLPSLSTPNPNSLLAPAFPFPPPSTFDSQKQFQFWSH